MLKNLAPDQRTLVLRFFATDAEAEVRSEDGSFGDEVAYLIAHAAALATKVWDSVPRENPAARYAPTVVGWAGTMLLTPDYWRFGQQLVSLALELARDDDTVLTEIQRSALRQSQSVGRFDTPGDRLGSFEDVLERSAPRLTISRDDGDEDDWPLLAISYTVTDPAVNESAAVALATGALEVMPRQVYGKLFLAGEGGLLFELDLLEDPSRELTPDALRQVCWVAVREGMRFADEFELQAYRPVGA